ncbi:MAG: hypothetical protein KAU50_08970 [Candidatus Marinimicrobia bacterium]|nr:hypothetical protein [Candidatus Neomarinimicrobiota bacterium]
MIETSKEYMPDFSDGDVFVHQLRRTIYHSNRRRAVAAGLTSFASLAFIFLFSFTSLQLQLKEDLWDAYLFSELSAEVYEAEAEEDLAWELYMEVLLEEESLDNLLDEIILLEEGTDLITAIDLKG